MSFLPNVFAAAEKATKVAASPTVVSGTPTPTTNPMLSSFVLLGVFALFIYFFMWRPQSKRIKEHRHMMETLKVDDEVIMSGGLLGKIKKIEDNIVYLSIADQVTIQVQKSAIASVLPKGTIK